MILFSGELFYSKDHDWICFTDLEAFIGVSRFKLTGIRKIDNICLFNYKPGDIIEEGTILLNLHYRDYIIPVHAPVTCTLLEVNNIIGNGRWELITENPEGIAWLFKVAPKQSDNSHLLPYDLYKKRFPCESLYSLNFLA